MKKAYLKGILSQTEIDKYLLTDKVGNEYEIVPEDKRNLSIIKGTIKDGRSVRVTLKEDGSLFYGTSEMKHFDDTKGGKVPNDFIELLDTIIESASENTTSTEKIDGIDINSFIANSVKLRPKVLIMEDLAWKYLIRSVLRGKNIMMTGPSGCGKTFAAQQIAKAFPNKDFFYFNLGSSQDPKSFLIGNTHYDNNVGTVFAESAFIKAIKTPGSIIMLDELTRAHPEAGNILMTVLDEGQRYVRIDDAKDSRVVNVAEGVTFIATANIGSEYHGTRLMDRALRDRFVEIEMKVLNTDQERKLLNYKFPKLDKNKINSIAEIAGLTREEMLKEEGDLTNMISTRITVEMSSLMVDGFTLDEAAQVAIYPFFSEDGGADSERSFVQKIVQKYLPVEEEDILNVGNTTEETNFLNENPLA